jgi:CHASE3 domain sensor protein
MASDNQTLINILNSVDELELFKNVSEEWSTILNEHNEEIKVKKLYSALIKESIRRETAERLAKDARSYSDLIQEQSKQRLSDLKENLENQITFLRQSILMLSLEQ